MLKIIYTHPHYAKTSEWEELVDGFKMHCFDLRFGYEVAPYGKWLYLGFITIYYGADTKKLLVNARS